MGCCHEANIQGARKVLLVLFTLFPDHISHFSDQMDSMFSLAPTDRNLLDSANAMAQLLKSTSTDVGNGPVKKQGKSTKEGSLPAREKCAKRESPKDGSQQKHSLPQQQQHQQPQQKKQKLSANNRADTKPERKTVDKKCEKPVDPPKNQTPAVIKKDLPATKVPKGKHKNLPPTPPSVVTKSPAPSLPSRKLTPMQQKMEAKLHGARFRFINEKLYTSTGVDAFSLFQKEPHLFDEVHGCWCMAYIHTDSIIKDSDPR